MPDGFNWQELIKLAAPALGGIAAGGGGADAAFMQAFQQGTQQAEQEKRLQAQEAQRAKAYDANYAMDLMTQLGTIEDPDQFAQLLNVGRQHSSDPTQFDAVTFSDAKKLAVRQKKARAKLDDLVKVHGPDVIDAHVAVEFEGQSVSPQDLLAMLELRATGPEGQPYQGPKKPSEVPSLQRETVLSGGKRVLANFNPKDGKYYDQSGAVLADAQPDQKPVDGELGEMNKTLKQLQIDAARANLNKPKGDGGPTGYQQFGMEERLAKAWTSASQSAREVTRQYSIMETGLKRFRAGDKNGGSQAVLVTFQKILDPTSVVRESEYARTTEGQSLLNRIEGYATRLAQGGTTLTDREMAEMVETGRQFMVSLRANTEGQRRRIEAQASQRKLNPAAIFDDVLMGEDGVSGASKPTADPLGIR